MDAPLLVARKLVAGYNGVPVVREIDFEVKAGEVVVLLGPNGVGKTTTLRTVAGILPAISGEIEFEGRRTTASTHKRALAGMAMITEERSVISRLSVWDNLRLARGGTPALALELFPELQALLSSSGGSLSGGEQQMLAVARGISRHPKLLIADELSLGLAPKITRRLLQAVRAAADRGAGVLLVEQHVRKVLDFADRAYVMRRGSIVMEGNAEKIRGRLSELEDTYLASSSN